MEGVAEIVETGSEKEAHITDVVHALRRKYPQYQDIPVLRKPETVIAIRSTKTTGWCAETLDIS